MTALAQPVIVTGAERAPSRNCAYTMNGTSRARSGLSSATYRGARSRAPGPGTAQVGRSSLVRAGVLGASTLGISVTPSRLIGVVVSVGTTSRASSSALISCRRAWLEDGYGPDVGDMRVGLYDDQHLRLARERDCVVGHLGVPVGAGPCGSAMRAPFEPVPARPGPRHGDHRGCSGAASAQRGGRHACLALRRTTPEVPRSHMSERMWPADHPSVLTIGRLT